MSDLTPRQSKLLHYLRRLVRENRPFTYEGAMAVMKCTDEAVRYHMRKLQHAGMAEFNTLRVGNDHDYSVTVTGLGSTPWNDFNGRLARRSESARQGLIEWRKRTGWSLNQIATAMSMVNGHITSAYLISKLLDGTMVQVDFLRDLSKLIDEYRNPGTFERWRDAIARNATRRKMDERDEILRRVEQVEREREERRRALLAAERRPREVKQRDYLDKATLAALSGQMMGRERVYG
jgi:transcriptional regulator with XRE-family HTH domain